MSLVIMCKIDVVPVRCSKEVKCFEFTNYVSYNLMDIAKGVAPAVLCLLRMRAYV